MITDEQYALVAEKSYWVEASKKDVDYHPKEGTQYFYDVDNKSLGQFHVLKVADNPFNGMQVMAV